MNRFNREENNMHSKSICKNANVCMYNIDSLVRNLQLIKMHLPNVC